jgi:hypothetical protein
MPLHWTQHGSALQHATACVSRLAIETPLPIGPLFLTDLLQQSLIQSFVFPFDLVPTTDVYFTIFLLVEHSTEPQPRGVGDMHLVPWMNRFLSDNTPNLGAIKGLLPTSFS